MKYRTLIPLGGALFGYLIATAALAQEPARNRTPPNRNQIPQTGEVLMESANSKHPNTEQKRFDLVFKGGTPRQFIEAVNAQSGLKVNVIIPMEHTNASLPSIEVYNVTIPQVFEAITAYGSGTKVVRKNTSRGRDEHAVSFTKGFRTNGRSLSEDSIWYFVNESPTSDPEPPEPVSVHVFQLASLLKDHSIDDITTAVKTTWQMLDSSVTPELKYHSDTGLLIAKGTGEQLQKVSEVLAQILQSGKKPAGTHTPPAPQPSTPGQP